MAVGARNVAYITYLGRPLPVHLQYMLCVPSTAATTAFLKIIYVEFHCGVKDNVLKFDSYREHFIPTSVLTCNTDSACCAPSDQMFNVDLTKSMPIASIHGVKIIRLD